MRQEWGADLGGFVLKDKIWFFGAYDRVTGQPGPARRWTSTTTRRSASDFPVSYFQNKYSGKLTFNLFQGTSIVGSVFSDSQTQEGVLFPRIPTSLNPVTNNGRRDTGGPDYAARLNQLFGSFGIFTFQYAQHKDRYTTKPFGLDVPAAPGLHRVSHAASRPRSSGGFGSVFGPTVNNSSKREAFAASFTGYVGNHEIKIGGDYQNDATFGTTYYTGGQRVQRPALPADGHQLLRPRPGAVLRQRADRRAARRGPVFYQHDLFVDGTAGDFEVIPALAVQHTDQALQPASSRTSGGSSRR